VSSPSLASTCDTNVLLGLKNIAGLERGCFPRITVSESATSRLMSNLPRHIACARAHAPWASSRAAAAHALKFPSASTAGIK
jgi:hypothetical protein